MFPLQLLVYHFPINRSSHKLITSPFQNERRITRPFFCFVCCFPRTDHFPVSAPPVFLFCVSLPSLFPFASSPVPILFSSFSSCRSRPNSFTLYLSIIARFSLSLSLFSPLPFLPSSLSYFLRILLIFRLTFFPPTLFPSSFLSFSSFHISLLLLFPFFSLFFFFLFPYSFSLFLSRMWRRQGKEEK